jgi:hypothetical protein
MALNEQEQEQEFLADLEARTGRSLGQWMALIAEQGFADKNEIIDWLRGLGLPFARASWLERIHSNGGRPIYQSGQGGTSLPPASEPRAAPKPRPKPVPSEREMADLEKLLAAGKGYRPLYDLLAAEIRAAIAEVAVRPRPGYVSLAAPREFAAVTLHPTEVRLGLDLGDRLFDDHVLKSRMRGPPATISHMIVLTDARQVNADLINLIKAANVRVNG